MGATCDLGRSQKAVACFAALAFIETEIRWTADFGFLINYFARKCEQISMYYGMSLISIREDVSGNELLRY
jgi:hypothetical protein